MYTLKRLYMWRMCSCKVYRLGLPHRRSNQDRKGMTCQVEVFSWMKLGNQYTREERVQCSRHIDKGIWRKWAHYFRSSRNYMDMRRCSRFYTKTKGMRGRLKMCFSRSCTNNNRANMLKMDRWDPQKFQGYTDIYCLTSTFVGSMRCSCWD